MINKLKYFLGTLTGLYPNLGFSQSIILSTSNLSDILTYLIIVLNILNPILFSTAFVVFFWGLSKFILNSDSKEEIEKGKNYMLWGIIALFILISFRVIITFISSSVGFGNAVNTPIIPQAP